MENAASVVSDVAGTCNNDGSTAGNADGTGAAVQFSAPRGIAIAPTSGSFALVADSGNGNIRRIDLETWAVTTLAGTGSQHGGEGADGNGTGECSCLPCFGFLDTLLRVQPQQTAAVFRSPTDVAISADETFALVC